MEVNCPWGARLARARAEANKRRPAVSLWNDCEGKEGSTGLREPRWQRGDEAAGYALRPYLLMISGP